MATGLLSRIRDSIKKEIENEKEAFAKGKITKDSYERRVGTVLGLQKALTIINAKIQEPERE